MPAPTGAGATTIIIEEDNAMFTTSAAGAAGSKRMQQIRDENAIEIEAIKAHLIAGLGRAPFAAEVISAEVIAATSVRAKRLRMSCKDDAAERRLLAKLMANTPFGMTPAPPLVPPKIQILGPRSVREAVLRCRAWRCARHGRGDRHGRGR